MSALWAEQDSNKKLKPIDGTLQCERALLGFPENKLMEIVANGA